MYTYKGARKSSESSHSQLVGYRDFIIPLFFLIDSFLPEKKP